MSLKEELGLKRGFKVLEHEAVLNIYFTASKLKKRADEFFRKFNLTDVQFNVMMLLHYQSDNGGGLSQAQLSKMMLVNRANITPLIDRMERAELVTRNSSADRRYNIIKMTERGKKLFGKVEPLYGKLVVEKMSAIKKGEQKQLIAVLEKVRSY